ncbi:hypothetical protein Glaag_4541 (plasmid) [Glaciecola sp. 4H-3-7+YE-5]|nr:hypothetical protein Glaag_4541 [Glaciecola sp. 4H-3-7+YE-5]|tara:strand:- start:726 stop:2336 length:1611 start_codon:yes stop_codon:yes gene_type:complete
MKKHFVISLFATSLVCLASKALAANTTANNCNQKERVELTTNDIFNLEDPDTIFLHRWANFFHIKTKNKTLYNEAAFFLEKCDLDHEDLKELERHLRGKKYIRDARVVFKANSEKVSVETWDNWSMMPTVDFGRKGGENKYAIGIKDRNLFGLGIDAELESFTNDQRSGYKFKTHFPLFLNNNINAQINFTSSDDGTSESVFIKKDFVSFDTSNAFNIGFDNFQQIDTQYKLGATYNQFEHNQRYSTASWQWLKKDSKADTLRFGIGFTNELHEFAVINETQNVDLISIAPPDREFIYPYLSVEYLQKDFRKLTNLNLINHIEDFNLGWNLTTQIGSDIGNTDTSPTLLWQSNLSKGIEIYEDAFWFITATFEGEMYSDSDNANRAVFSLNNEYFHKINNNWGAYLKNSSQFSENQFKDSPIVLGGESGLRGYPLQYRHGNHSTQFTAEARYYPHINIYKLVELGAAAFIDTGRVFGSSDNTTYQDSWMTSVGLGARFYSTQTSEARVIHVDIIKPLTSDANVNGVEFRITTKHSF